MRSLLPAVAGGALLIGPALASEPSALIPSEEDLAPLHLVGEVENYTPETLWEKIDGEAELYRRFDLQQASMAYFEDPEDRDRGLEVSIFTMGSPLDAFGVFSTLRAPESPIEPLGNGGIRDTYRVLFWHGRRFVSLHAFGAEGTRPGDLQSVADAVLVKLGPPPGIPTVLSVFESLADPLTVRLYPDHMFGRELLPAGLVGVDPSGITVFLATDPNQGTEVLRKYEGFVADPKRHPLQGFEVLSGTDPDLGPITIAVAGERLVGARVGFEETGARAILIRLLDLSRD